MFKCVFGDPLDGISNYSLHSQAVDHRPPVASVVLLLPLGQPPHQLEDGALGKGRVPVGGPANELEVLH